MGWYIRKSVQFGPIRFNLSKSGIGTSVGIKGFRHGVRPNGKGYLHAGRHGLYYRRELGNLIPKIIYRMCFVAGNSYFNISFVVSIFANFFSGINMWNAHASCKLTPMLGQSNCCYEQIGGIA